MSYHKWGRSFYNSLIMGTRLWISFLMLLWLLTAGCLSSGRGAQDAWGTPIPLSATIASATDGSTQAQGCGGDSTAFAESTPEPLPGHPLPRLAPTVSPIAVTAITVDNVRFIEPIALVSKKDGVFCFQEDGESLAISHDRRTRVYDAPKFYERQEFSHQAMVRMSAFGPMDSMLATLEGPEADGRAVIWNIQDGQSLATLNHVWGAMGWMEKGPALLAVTRTPSGSAILTRLTPGGERARVMEVEAKLLAVSEDGRYVLLQNGGLWDLVKGQKVYQGPRLRDGFLLSEGPSLLFWAEDGTWGVWRKEGKAFLLDPDIDMARLDPAGETMVFVQNAEDEVRLMQMSVIDGQEHLLWRSHGGRITAMAFHPQGRLLAVATRESKDVPQIRWWDMATARALGESSAFQHKVSRMVFSADGRRLATGGEDGVLVWGVIAP